MTDRALADALAYADGCLEADRRVGFEARLDSDPDLRRKVALWQAQNDALRKAYAGAPRSRIHRTLPRPSNENAPPERVKRSAGRLYAHPLANEVAERRVRRRRKRSLLQFVAMVGLSAFFSAFAFGGPADPRTALMDAGLAAYRAIALESAAPFDISTSDARRVAAWLGPRFQGEAIEPILAAPDWTLRGARLVPGLQGSAAFVVFQSAAHAMAGLLIEPIEGLTRASFESRVADGFVQAARVSGGLGLAVVARDPGLAASVILVRPSLTRPGG